MASLLRNLSRRSNWSANENANVTEVAHDCPWFPEVPVALRNRLVDGQRPSWDPSSNERSDLQSGSAPGFGSTFCIPFAIKVRQLPGGLSAISGGRWHLLGPEIHNNGSTGQALFMWEVDGNGRWRVNMNAGGSSPFYLRAPDGSQWNPPVRVGEWEPFSVLWIPHTSSGSGRIEVYHGSTLVAARSGATANSQGPGYWKLANYRNSAISGTTEYDIIWPGVYDELVIVGNTVPAPPPSEPPPPPPPSPTVSITTDDKGRYSVALTNGESVASLLLGVAGDPFAPITVEPAALVSGQFPTANLTPGTTYWSWVVARDASGADLASASDPFSLVAPLPPPPPPDPEPDPDDPCADLREANENLAAALAAEQDAHAATRAELAAVRAAVAAETQRHTAAIADALEG